ncbi:hypothetical protein [Phenylobacterium sp.]|jgi:hypothetical protein|uniref:hypothetical protein n=1 Tax=Phenylobacterium sp. TaxID=1871053 RepID=UPI002F91D636
MSLRLLKPLDCLPAAGGGVVPGQTVYLGANTGPTYRVVALDGEKAWVRDEQKGAEHIVNIWRCYPAFVD